MLAHWQASARRPFAYPTPQLRAILDQAALRCRPADAEPAYAWLLPDDPAARLPQPWQQGAEALVDVVKFRREMADTTPAPLSASPPHGFPTILLDIFLSAAAAPMYRLL